jgi:hypothetical protein
MQHHRLDQPRWLAQGPNLRDITRREGCHGMKDEPARWQANDRHHPAMSRAQDGERISFGPQVLGKLFHRSNNEPG